MLEPVTAITPAYVETPKGRYGYRYLVGADGSFSKVRQYLKLPQEHVAGWAFHFVVDKPSHEFRVCWLPGTFPNGYGYVMSKNKGSTMIGGAITGKDASMKDLSVRVRRWVEAEFGLDTSSLRSEGFRGNADFRGWRFGDVFLVGDAAGLLNPVTTEGIYYAVKSGEGVAKTILGDPEGRKIMRKMSDTHAGQVLLFDVIHNRMLPFHYAAGWLFSRPGKGLRKIIFDKVFWMFMER